MRTSHCKLQKRKVIFCDTWSPAHGITHPLCHWLDVQHCKSLKNSWYLVRQGAVVGKSWPGWNSDCFSNDCLPWSGMAVNAPLSYIWASLGILFSSRSKTVWPASLFSKQLSISNEFSLAFCEAGALVWSKFPNSNSNAEGGYKNIYFGDYPIPFTSRTPVLMLFAVRFVCIAQEQHSSNNLDY